MKEFYATSQISNLYWTITKYHLATILHCFFKCYTELRTRKNLKPTGDLIENQGIYYIFK